MEILEIASKFDLPSKPIRYKECKVGHINSTFFIYDSEDRAYVLQKINTYVFKNPEELMSNIFNVTDYVRNILKESGEDCERGTLHFRKCIDGKLFYTDPEGLCWRVYDFVDHVVCLQMADNPDVFSDVGFGFGNFQRQLSGFDASKLYETIPDFHNTVKRFENFVASLEADKVGRASGVQEDINFVLNHQEICSYIVRKIGNGDLPLRVTHNDTKINNLLLDETTLKPLCVIDLDTIMPGSVLYDFGDAIRSGATSAAEDEKDLSKVFFREKYFEAFVKGFTAGLNGALTDEEIMDFPAGAMIITLETGIRFLTDYLDGDVYFRTEYPEHNLVRARNQFKLVSDMESRYDDFIAIAQKYTSK